MVLHELSIAEELVSAAVEALQGGAEGRALSEVFVEEVRVRVGVLSGVDGESLRFCFGVVSASTPLSGARLEIEEVPVVIYCESCQEERELPGIQRFVCPCCGAPSGEVRQGRGLELSSLSWSDRGQD